jgi:hypothetical protein
VSAPSPRSGTTSPHPPLPHSGRGGFESASEQTGRGSRQQVGNSAQQSRQIIEHFIVPKTQHGVSQTLQLRVSHSVVSSSIGCVVNSAVKFNHDFGAGAAEVHDVPSNWFLSFEFPAAYRVSAQLEPQPLFSRRWLLPIVSSQFRQIRTSHSYSVKPTPEPQSPLSWVRERGWGRGS